MTKVAPAGLGRRTPTMPAVRIAVLVSGSGSNLQSILDAERSDEAFETVVVISDRPDVKALERAQAADVPAEVVSWGAYEDRDAFTKAICDVALRHGAEAIVCAGFMRILTPVLLERFPNRVLNIHPALLPAFPGAHAVEEALAYGAKVTGVTVHFVDEQVDHGPIIAQESVQVRPDDTPATLHARLQTIEHRLYPAVVKALAEDRLEVSGRTVNWKEPTE